MDKLGEQLPASLAPEMDREPVTCLGRRLQHLAPAPASSAAFHTGILAPFSCPQTLGSPTQDTPRGSEPWVPPTTPHKPPKPGQLPATH